MNLIVSLLVSATAPTLISRTPLASDPHQFFSPNREYRALVEYEQGNTEFVPFSRIELQDASGRVQYSRPGGGHTVLDIADNGRVVGADFDGPISGRAKLHFYDPTGREVGTAEVGFYGARRFSADGSAFCVNDGRTGLRVFSAEGQELANLGYGSEFAVSADGRCVALARNDAVVLFRDGEEAGRIPLATPFVRQLRFSADGTLFGYAERRELRVFRLADREPVLSWRPGETDPELLSLDISARDGLVLAGLGKAHGRCVVVLLDLAGDELWRQETVRERWNALTPAVGFAPDRTFRVESAEDVEVFGWEGE